MCVWRRSTAVGNLMSLLLLVWACVLCEDSGISIAVGDASGIRNHSDRVSAAVDTVTDAQSCRPGRNAGGMRKQSCSSRLTFDLTSLLSAYQHVPESTQRREWQYERLHLSHRFRSISFFIFHYFNQQKMSQSQTNVYQMHGFRKMHYLD